MPSDRSEKRTLLTHMPARLESTGKERRTSDVGAHTVSNLLFTGCYVCAGVTITTAKCNDPDAQCHFITAAQL